MGCKGQDGETKNAEDVILSFFHDEDSLSEEIVFPIDKNPEEVKAVIDTMLNCHILEEIQPDTWQIHLYGAGKAAKKEDVVMQHKCNTKATYTITISTVTVRLIVTIIPV